MKTKMKGMIAAMPTPFHADESINFDGVKTLIKHLADGGIHGILIGGSTGEYSLMSMEERKKLISFACEADHGEAYLIAGCSCARPRDTLEMVKHAEKAGADFALVLPPYYLKTSEEGILDYYKFLSENSNIDIVIYHYPAATGVELSPALIMKMSKIPNVVAVKDTAEMEHTSKLLELKDDSFSVINGNEHLIMGTLSAGAEGTMGIIHNLVPGLMRQIYDAFQANDVHKAREINKKLLSLYTMMEDEPYPGPIKAALEILGLPGGVPRKPIVPASENMKARLKTALQELKLV